MKRKIPFLSESPFIYMNILVIHPTNKKSGQVKEKASIYELTTFLIRRV